jgi:hypothetical protein
MVWPPKTHAAARCAVAGVPIAICWALTAYNLNLRPYKACIPINRHTIASTQGGMHIRARATVLADQGAACLTPGGWPLADTAAKELNVPNSA